MAFGKERRNGLVLADTGFPAGSPGGYPDSLSTLAHVHLLHQGVNEVQMVSAL